MDGLKPVKTMYRIWWLILSVGLLLLGLLFATDGSAPLHIMVLLLGGGLAGTIAMSYVLFFRKDSAEESETNE